MVHKSYDRLTHETHVDDFNIDFIRYFTKKNLIFNIIGSLIGVFLFYYLNMQSVFFEYKNEAILFYIIGSALVFIALTAIAKNAGNSLRASARLSGRRGLFSYMTITIIVTVAILITGSVALTDTFERFFFIFIGSQITSALFAVPLDFLSTFKRE